MPETDLTLWAAVPYLPPLDASTDDADDADRDALDIIADLLREERIA